MCPDRLHSSLTARRSVSRVEKGGWDCSATSRTVGHHAVVAARHVSRAPARVLHRLPSALLQQRLRTHARDSERSHPMATYAPRPLSRRAMLRNSSLVIASAAGAVLLAACGGSTPAPAPAKPAEGKPAEA